MMHNSATLRPFSRFSGIKAGILLGMILLMNTKLDGQERIQREFRGVWVATVYNIDWPSESNLPQALQWKEMMDLLEQFRRLNFNAIILQARPAADAFYPSTLEPWSRYLTGTQGKTPDGWEDPLKTFIEECHKNGMEFHAWMNPFRIKLNLSDSLAPGHIALQHPEWTVEYGNQLYFDPGIPAVREWLGRVTSDLVRRYEVDAIHFDDYFYPYPVDDKDFPDTSSFEKYGIGFSLAEKADWRRNNVNELIRLLQDTIKSIKPWVKFGISPFGVWRNRETDPMGSATTAGTTNYDDLYADILLWMREGWIDYAMPQLYWEFGHEAADFQTLAHWWNDHSYGKTLIIGQAAYRTRRAANAAWKKGDQLPRQLELIRSLPNLKGSCYFSARDFHYPLSGFTKALEKKYYSSPALVPAMLDSDTIPPGIPQNVSVSTEGRKVWINWEEPNMDNAGDMAWYAVYSIGKNPEKNNQKLIGITGSEYNTLLIGKKKLFRFRKTFYAVSALDHNWNEGGLSTTIPQRGITLRQ